MFDSYQLTNIHVVKNFGEVRQVKMKCCEIFGRWSRFHGRSRGHGHGSNNDCHHQEKGIDSCHPMKKKSNKSFVHFFQLTKLRSQQCYRK